MNDRIKKLREQSINSVPCITSERASLVTEFYKSDKAQSVSAPVKRALAFKYVMDNKKININEGELIVGERGPEPKVTPTYPELTTHSLKDLDILDKRKKIPFKVSREVKDFYKKVVIPFWNGKTIREKVFSEMSAEWKNAFNSGGNTKL